MPEPRSKSLLHWEPFPYIVLFVLVVVAGSISPDAAPVAFWIAAAFAGAAVVFFLVAYTSYGRRARLNPDPAGNLTTLDGLTIVSAEHTASATNPTVSVADARKRQNAIDIIRARGGAQVRAVLVPRASRWYARRYRVGVQLVGGEQIRHAGFLPDTADERWREELGALRRAGTFVSVPAHIGGTARPFTVDLDLSGLADAVAASASER